MEAKPCGLITVVPPALQNEWVERLPGLVKSFRPAALIFQRPFPDVLAKAIAGAKAFELAILLADNVGEAKDSGANGVYFSSAEADMAKAREELGSAAILGAACGLSRHAAMENAEAGADFVAFDASKPAAWEEAAALSAWWDDVTSVPAALAFGSLRPDMTVLSKARPDFLLLQETERAGESLTFATEFGLQSQT
ncbi:MAG: thiamine phosphate synthase [Rhodomicrobium sp.]|nr:thiamine phosphate synthase [Rhodomicrobium sp.]